MCTYMYYIFEYSVSIQVSWLRVSDVQVLTVGGLVFSSDPRIQIDVKVKQQKYSVHLLYTKQKLL